MVRFELSRMRQSQPGCGYSPGSKVSENEAKSTLRRLSRLRIWWHTSVKHTLYRVQRMACINSARKHLTTTFPITQRGLLPRCRAKIARSDGKAGGADERDVGRMTREDPRLSGSWGLCYGNRRIWIEDIGWNDLRVIPSYATSQVMTQCCWGLSYETCCCHQPTVQYMHFRAHLGD
jgi:hypothetical protein